MAELTNIEAKLGEVVGLAIAAQVATKAVARLARADKELGIAELLKRMQAEAKEAEQRGTSAALRAIHRGESGEGGAGGGEILFGTRAGAR